MIDEEDEVDQSEDSLDNTEETSGEECSVSSSNTNTFEDSRRVVVYSVDARSVLPEKERSTEEESPLDFSARSKQLERLPKSKTASDHLSFDVRFNSVNLLLNIDIILRKGSDPAKVLDGLLSLPLGHQPSRTFVQPERTEEEHARWDDLDGERDDPLGVVRRESLVDSVVDPKAYESTNLPTKFKHADKSPTNSRWRDFRDVDR